MMTAMLVAILACGSKSRWLAKDRFLDMLGTVFKNAALRVTMDATPAPDTHVAAFIEKLRAVPSLFFSP